MSEAANRQAFDAAAATYDADKPWLGELAEQAAARIRAAADLTGKTCLDIGCGTGLVSQRLAPFSGHVYGADVSQGMVDAFNAKAAASDALRGRMAAARVQLTDAAQVAAAQAAGGLPADGAVQVAWAQLVLHHVDDCAALLAAAGKLLAPGGRLFLVDLLRTPESHLFHAPGHHHSVSHVGGFSRDQLAGQLSAAGLQLAAFDPSAMARVKEVEGAGASGGGEGGGESGGGAGKRVMSFPLFFAEAVKPEA